MHTFAALLLGTIVGVVVGIGIALTLSNESPWLPLLCPGYSVLRLLSCVTETGVGMAAPRATPLLYANASAYGLLGLVAACGFRFRCTHRLGRAALAIAVGGTAGFVLLAAECALALYGGPAFMGDVVMPVGLAIFAAAPTLGVFVYRRSAGSGAACTP